MAESSSGTDDADQMWECFYPACRKKFPLALIKLGEFCPGCGKTILPTVCCAADSENRDESDPSPDSFAEQKLEAAGSVPVPAKSEELPKTKVQVLTEAPSRSSEQEAASESQSENNESLSLTVTEQPPSSKPKEAKSTPEKPTPDAASLPATNDQAVACNSPGNIGQSSVPSNSLSQPNKESKERVSSSHNTETDTSESDKTTENTSTPKETTTNSDSSSSSVTSTTPKSEDTSGNDDHDIHDPAHKEAVPVSEESLGDINVDPVTRQCVPKPEENINNGNAATSDKPRNDSDSDHGSTATSHQQSESEDDDSSGEYHDATSDPIQTNTKDSSSETCAFCEKCKIKFLSPTAKVCNKCGRPPARDGGNSSQESSPSQLHINAQPTPPQYKQVFGVPPTSSEQKMGTQKEEKDPAEGHQETVTQKEKNSAEGHSSAIDKDTNESSKDSSRKRKRSRTDSHSRDEDPGKPMLSDSGKEDTTMGEQLPGSSSVDIDPNNNPHQQVGAPSALPDEEPIGVRKSDRDEVLLERTKMGKQKKKGGSKTKTEKPNESDEPKVPKGLQAPDNESIKVIFHVLVPLQVWKWDATSKICLRFGHKDLGDWVKYDCGEGNFQIRDIEPGLCEMICELRIQASILQQPIPYKYVIYSPKTRGKDKVNMVYEKINFNNRTRQSVDPNRALVISKEKLSEAYQGYYHQYDTLVYPSTTTVSKGALANFKRTGKTFLSFLGIIADSSALEGDTQEVEIQPPRNIENRQKCLFAYLEQYKQVLCVTDSKERHIVFSAVLNEIQHIVKSLLYPHIIHQKETKSIKHTLDEPQVFLQSLNEWILSTVNQLHDMPYSGQRVLSATCLTVLIHQLDKKHKLPRENLSEIRATLANLLCLRPNLDCMKCPEYDFVHGVLNTPKDRTAASNSILTLCDKITAEGKYFDWLFCLPLYNLLKHGSFFEDVTFLGPKQLDSRWSELEKLLHLQPIRESTFDSGFKLISVYRELKHLIVLDPRLLQVFIYVCPRVELEVLFDEIHPNVSIAWLSNMMMSLPLFSISQSQLQWLSWIEQVSARMLEKQPTKVNELFTIMDCSRTLFTRSTLITSEVNNNIFPLIIASLSLALKSIVHFKQHCPDSEEFKKKQCIQKAISNLDTSLRKWLKTGSVIGGTMFGGYEDIGWTRKHSLRKGDVEKKLWQGLLTVDCPFPDVREMWLMKNKAFLTERVAAVPDDLKLDLLVMMEDNEEQYEILTAVVFDSAVKAIENVLSKSSEYAQQRFDELAGHPDSILIGKVLGTMIFKQYPRFCSSGGSQDITLDELLGWYLWPNFLKIFGSSSKLKYGLPDACQVACTCALAMFESVCAKLKSGDITMIDLQKIENNEKQMKRLCTTVTKFSEDEKHAYSYDTLRTILLQRVCEFRSFQRCKSTYVSICRWVPTSDRVQGLNELIQDLRSDYRAFTIKDLCSVKDGHVELKCFQAARPLDEFSEQFMIMMVKKPNLFIRPLEKRMKQVMSNNTDLTISSLSTLIWKPVFESCQALLNSLIDQTIKLAKVDLHFKELAKDFETHVTMLASGVENCLQGVKLPSAKLQLSMNRVRSYWKLCEYRDGADVFLQLKEVLNLQNGDFKNVETFSTEFSTAMKDQTLADVDDTLIETGRFLEDVAKNPQKKASLEMFIRCQDVINWLRETTKDVSDIQGFVTVALATAAGGEDDFKSDRLSNLRTVGSAFASFIYNINSQDGYRQLEAKCKSVWDALKKNPGLPKLLDDCNKDLSWYQSIRETQGSVETTSYGQMRNILKYGCYRVGRPSGATPHSVHDLISMTLKEKDKKLPKKKYTLDELRDLESKLVLICGNKAESRTEVDHFLNLLHNVTRIAEVFLDLQLAGNVEHSGKILTFRCAQYSGGTKDPMFQEKIGKEMVDQLRDQAKLLEKALDDWKTEIQEARRQYYQLNYYTTVQLLVLRKEFGHFKASSSYCLSPNVIALLQRVSPLIESVIKDCILKVVNEQQISPVDIATGGIPIAVDIDSTLEQFESNRDILRESVDSEAPSERATIPKPCPMHSSSKASVSVASRNVPSITTSDLNNEQKEILTRSVNHLRYSELHVLRAFEECGLEANRYDIETWCDINDDNYSDEEDGSETGESELDEEEEQTTSPESSDESDSEDVVPKSIHPVSELLGSGAEQRPNEAHISPKIQIVVRQTIDQSHPDVQKLLDSDYGLEESISAVERFGRNLAAAMDFLECENDSGSDEGGLSLSQDHTPLNSLPGPVFEEDGFNDQKIRLLCDPDAGNKYFTLDQLGRTLLLLSDGDSPGAVPVPRPFNSTLLKSGHPNLLVTPPELVLRTVLSLYMHNMDKVDCPLPTHEEVLICNSTTTTEEVILLWRKSIFDPGFTRIFCLAHAERLSYQVCDASLRALSELSQGRKDYRLVIVCSKEDEEKSHIISKLHLFRRPAIPSFRDDECKQYLKYHFVQGIDSYQTSDSGITATSASMADPEMSCVRVVSSTRSGMGKSLYIQRMTESLQTKCPASRSAVCVTIPVHGPVITADMMLDFFENCMDKDVCTIYHLDIAPAILSDVDTVLFSLLILRGLDDSKGRVWRCHPRQLYAVEVTLPAKQVDRQEAVTPSQTLQLLDLLPSMKCISPCNTMKTTDSKEIGMDQTEFEGPTIQRVYQYLRRHSANHDLDSFTYMDLVEGNVPDYLKIILAKCGIRDPSWSEIHHFTKFLDIQLNACEESVYCDETLVGDVMSGLKGFVVKFMIRMSQDFSTPSLKGVIATEDAQQFMEDDNDNSDLVQYEIVVRRQWEQSSHPYIFFNQDGMSVTFVGFMVTQNGDLIDPAQGRRVLEPAIMRPQLYAGLKQNRVNFNEDYRGWRKDQMINKIATVMGIDYMHDPDDTYVLTTDNLIKTLAIQMRFRCDIPVVIMGETGCGKTRLIRYMCDLARQGLSIRNMLIMKIHGGITDTNVAEFVKRAETVAEENKAVSKGVDTVVFFDEANTTDSIGLIKEIMCDRRLNGRPISKDLKFIAACNPYRRHTEEMIEKLETAGLGFYVRESETQQKLGKIPLRQLVYRVLDLPPSMRPLVYDFGQLNTGTEHDYVKQIVTDHVTNNPLLSNENSSIIPAIARVLAESQKYMRERNDECSFVSLRDVERAMIVFEYFYEKMNLFAPLINEKAELEITESEDEYEESDEEEGLYASLTQQVFHPSNITRALVLAVSICYHARLQDREGYEDLISGQFQNPLNLPRGAQDFRDQIKWCQEVLLDNMRLGSNIARNAALRENVFMMAICIELRIPLFLVGKPGSSKSLAKSIIQDSMHGQGSQTELLRGFKQVHMFSYQCSQLSTPESVIEVFKQADKFQAKQDTKQYVSVVVLDEVGLAEDSPNLPLKALHPLLEDGTEGAGKDDQQKTIGREKRVAFIGISNWALDPAKMNRGVMVTRGDPGLEELKLSARGICSNQKNDPIRERLQDYFDPLSSSYMEICQKQERQFFGLRDFYSLIKMLYWMCKRTEGLPLSGPQLEHAIRRNFGGLISDTFDPIEIFRERVDLNTHHWELSTLSETIRKEINPDCSRLGLIKTSLRTKDTTWHGENRYLLFLTENYAALDILEHYLTVGSEPTESREGRSEEDSNSEEEITSKPFILFGSSFPKDKEYTQICRNINQIKICMETGRTVILLNLENLYESLYDVLNQYYMYYGEARYVDLGLQTHRVKCRVHDNFKLILIAEKNTVYEKFPTPLINRLEKHFVLTSSVLEEWQQGVLKEFTIWIHQFSNTSDPRGNRFKEPHAFIGYQKDTPAAVVFQATNQMQAILRNGGSMSPAWQRLERAGVLENISPEDLLMEDQDCEEWKVTVFKLSQYLLLQTASEDALFRLKHSKLPEQEIKRAMDVYYHSQVHSSILDFLKYSISQRDYDCSNELFLQVTTHSHLMNDEELAGASQIISGEIVCYDLHEFDTELDFSNKISPTFHRDDGESCSSLVIIQCDSGHHNSDLIACARYRIYDEAVRAKSKKRIQERNTGATHVLFIIRLPPQEVKSAFVGFQGDPWISVHIDDLRPTSRATVIPEQAIKAKISELFIGEIDNNTPSNVAGMEMEYSTQDSGSVNSDSEEMSIGGSHENLSDQEQMEVSSNEEIIAASNVETIPSGVILTSTTEIKGDSSLAPLEVVYSTSASPPKVLNEVSMPAQVPHCEEDINPDEEPERELEHLSDAPMRPTFHSQHHRLHGCIQAAVSALKDSEKDRNKQRLQKLICLIPKDPTNDLDYSKFYGLLVKFVHRALMERERERVDEEDWVVIEAMNARKLHNGGTFRNVLAHRIDEVITPYFAEIIAAIDRNCNLDLLEDSNKEEILNESPLSCFWLSMFTLVQIDFSSLAQGKTIIETDFHCQLPFSWIIKEIVDSQMVNIESADTTLRGAHAQICGLLSQTDLGKVLSEVMEEDCEQFYQFYLRDFVRIIYKSKHKQDLQDMEHTLIADALNKMVHAPQLCSMDGHESLILRVTALHLVYNQCHSEILWFGQLALHNPGILTHLLSTVSHGIDQVLEFNLHLFAVEKVLTDFESPLSKDKPADNLSRWLDDVRLSQNVINSVLSLKPQGDTISPLRLTWQRLRAVQMFVEHVLLPFSDVDVVVTYARRLDGRLSAGRDSDFLKKEALDIVKNQVNNMDKQLKKDKSTIKNKIKKCCNSFFMEVVSSLCFGGQQTPEPDLIKMLMDTVLQENQTRELSPYNEPKVDTTPTIRSFLLQLLLEHSPKQVKEYLDDYFGRSCRIVGGSKSESGVDHGLCLLCIQCFEDSLIKESSKMSQEGKDQHTFQAAAESYTILQECSRSKEISLRYLEAIAQARYALSVLAENLSVNVHIVNKDLLQVSSTMCTNGNINQVDITCQNDTTGPVVYLLRLLVRQFGFPCLTTVSESHPWVVPRELRRGEEEQQCIDPFVMYQQAYKQLRSAVNTALYTKEVDEFTSVLQTHGDTALLALAIYQEATLTHASAVPAKQLQPEAIEMLNEFILNNKLLSTNMKHVSRSLLANQQGGPLAQLTVLPQQPALFGTLRPIVVHTACVMICHQKMDILLPFVNIFNNPAVLTTAYLPTMQEDLLEEIKKSGIVGTYYECPNGHPYLVGGPGSGGSCALPTQRDTCRECGRPIGGNTMQELQNAGNRGARQHDTTKTGHDLGEPTRRQTPEGRERHLSAPAVCIVRAIMHSAFIWASCNNEHTIDALSQVVSPRVLPRDLPEFFWRHLERDIEDLSRITGRGADECAMIIHIILGQIMSATPPSVSNAKLLANKEARVKWERLFNQNYIEPVLESLDKRVRKAMDLVAKDDKQEHDRLFYLAYERVKVDESRLESHLWTFRSRINVNHLRSYLMQQKKLTVKILDAFLQDELNLRATQYLPAIVKLQRFLFDKFHQRLDKGKAKIQTIREFVKDIRNENSRNDCCEMIDSLKKAWALVGQKLKHHKRLPVDDKYLIPAITDDTELEYLIPTTMGEGRCTTSLVDFLVLTHNNFIEKCRGIVSSRSSSAVWREHHIQIAHVQPCHLLDYEQQLQSIILSHCHYSLTVGKGQDIKYDLPALEKHILNRFIYGKPMILLHIPHVAYRKDIYTTVTFLAIREKVKPQVAIPQRVQQDIITELNTPDRLRDALMVVDIVLGFLSSGGGNSKVSLRKFIDVRKMRKKYFSAKAKEYCTLGHIISLWETISVELARQLWLKKLEPFEGIPDNYSKDLSENQITELNKCLKTFDLGLLLGSLFEFIEVHVKHTTAKEEDWALVEAVEYYTLDTKKEELPHFNEEFPKSITVDQAVATWKHIVDFQEKLKAAR